MTQQNPLTKLKKKQLTTLSAVILMAGMMGPLPASADSKADGRRHYDRHDQTQNHRGHNNRGHNNRGHNNRAHNNRGSHRNRAPNSNYTRSHYTPYSHYDSLRDRYHSRPYSYSGAYSGNYSSPLRSRPVTYSSFQRGYNSRPYTSSIGISFSFDSAAPRYPWASSYGLYQPSYGNYGSYQARTHCRRVTMNGWHHGHPEAVSVKLCSNPWNGEYIVQGSERLIRCPW